jgi:hypothetical protein
MLPKQTENIVTTILYFLEPLIFSVNKIKDKHYICVDTHGTMLNIGK